MSESPAAIRSEPAPVLRVGDLVAAQPDPVGAARDVSRTWAIAAVAVAVLARLVPSLDARTPVVMWDEIGYLTNARLIAGVGGGASLPMEFYSSGWSLLIAPLFVVSADFGVIFRSAIILSVATGCLVLVPLTGVLRRAARLPTHLAVVVAALASMAPGPAAMSGFVFAESLLTLVVTTAVYLVYLMRDGGPPWTPVAFGAVAAYAHWIHARAIVIPVLAVVVLVGLAVRRPPSRPWVVLAAAIMLGLEVGRVRLDSWLQATAYVSTGSRLSTGLAKLTEITPRDLTQIAVGQGWYLLASTAGLAGLGAWVLVRRVHARGLRRAWAPDTFALAVVAGLVAVSVVHFVRQFPDPGRLDYYAYGRYVDTVVPLLVAFAGAWWVARPRRRTIAVAGATIAVALGVLGAMVVVAAGGTDNLRDKAFADFCVAGLMWAVDPTVRVLPVAVATGGAAGALLLLLASRRAAVLACVWTVLCLLGGGVGEIRVLQERHPQWNSDLRRVLEALAPAEFAYDTREGTLQGRNGYQVALPRASVSYFSSDAGLPAEALVVSRKDWPEGQAAGAVLVASETWSDEALWVQPGVEQDRLAEAGWLGKTLPSSARQAAVDLHGGPEQGQVVALHGLENVTVTVRNTGVGAPWRPLGTRGPDPLGSVRVLTRWTCTDIIGVTELPRTTLPGDTVSITVPLDPANLEGAPTCIVTLDLLEEGVGTFSAVPPVSFEVVR